MFTTRVPVTTVSVRIFAIVNMFCVEFNTVRGAIHPLAKIEVLKLETYKLKARRL